MGFLEWLYDFAMSGVLEEDDDFITILRKIISRMFGLASLFAGAGAYYAYRAAVAEPSEQPALIALTVLVFMFGLVMCAPFALYVQCTKQTPDWLMLYALVMAAIITCGWDIFTDFFPVRSTSIAIAIMTISSRLESGTMWIVGFLCIYYIIVEIRDAFGLPLRMSDPYKGSGVEKLLFSFPGILAMLLIPAMVAGMVHEFVKLIAAAKQSILLAQDISQLLIRYDTDGVRDFLELTTVPEEEGGIEGVSKELVDAFTTIAANLDIYRPHLPSYVLPRDEDGDDEMGQFVSERLRERNKNRKKMTDSTSITSSNSQATDSESDLESRRTDDNSSFVSAHQQGELGERRSSSASDFGHPSALGNSSSGNFEDSKKAPPSVLGVKSAVGEEEDSEKKRSKSSSSKNRKSHSSTKIKDRKASPQQQQLFLVGARVDRVVLCKVNFHKFCRLICNIAGGDPAMLRNSAIYRQQMLQRQQQQQQQQQPPSGASNSSSTGSAQSGGSAAAPATSDTLTLAAQIGGGGGEPTTPVMASTGDEQLDAAIATVAALTDADIAAIRKHLQGILTGRVNKLVEGLLDHGATHEASIHSMIGDTIIVSWNATLRSSHNELKCCRFLMGLKAVMRRAMQQAAAVTAGSSSKAAEASGLSSEMSVTLDSLQRLQRSDSSMLVGGIAGGMLSHSPSFHSGDQNNNINTNRSGMSSYVTSPVGSPTKPALGGAQFSSFSAPTLAAAAGPSSTISSASPHSGTNLPLSPTTAVTRRGTLLPIVLRNDDDEKSGSGGGTAILIEKEETGVFMPGQVETPGEIVVGIGAGATSSRSETSSQSSSGQTGKTGSSSGQSGASSSNTTASTHKPGSSHSNSSSAPAPFRTPPSAGLANAGRHSSAFFSAHNSTDLPVSPSAMRERRGSFHPCADGDEDIPDDLLSAAAVVGSAWCQIGGGQKRQAFMLSNFSHLDVLDQTTSFAFNNNMTCVCRHIQSSVQHEFMLRGCTLLPPTGHKSYLLNATMAQQAIELHRKMKTTTTMGSSSSHNHPSSSQPDMGSGGMRQGNSNSSAATSGHGGGGGAGMKSESLTNNTHNNTVDMMMMTPSAEPSQNSNSGGSDSIATGPAVVERKASTSSTFPSITGAADALSREASGEQDPHRRNSDSLSCGAPGGGTRAFPTMQESDVSNLMTPPDSHLQAPSGGIQDYLAALAQIGDAVTSPPQHNLNSNLSFGTASGQQNSWIGGGGGAATATTSTTAAVPNVMIGTPIYELVSVRKLSNKDDEWLYQIQETSEEESSGEALQCTLLTNCVAQLARGSIDRGQRILHGMQVDHPGVQSLRAYQTMNDVVVSILKLLVPHVKRQQQQAFVRSGGSGSVGDLWNDSITDATSSVAKNPWTTVG